MVQAKEVDQEEYFINLYKMRVEESIHSIEQNPKVNELPKVLTNKINKQALIVF